jgi:hypothetical protein
MAFHRIHFLANETPSSKSLNHFYVWLAKKKENYNSFSNHELSALFYYADADTLYLGVTGELDIDPLPPGNPSRTTPEDTGNLVLFFDWSGYQGRGNQQLDPLRIGGSGVFLSWGGMNKTTMDFDADFAMAFNTGNNDEVIVMDAVRYGPDSTSAILADTVFGPDLLQYEGAQAVHSVSGVFGGNSDAEIVYAYRNGNVSESNYWHGLEIKIPYNAFNSVTGGNGLCVFVALTDKKGFFSNEIIPGRANTQTHLGNDVDFRAIPYQDLCAPILQMLPVDLINFDGLQKEGKTYLNWATASEQNSEAFYIERRSTLSPWETIGEVAASGNTSKQQDYNFIDHSPSEVRMLYRLRQVDLDGAVHYSNIITVENRFGTQLDFKVFPNPASGEARIYTGTPLPAGSRIQVLDLSGKRLLDFEAEEGARDIRLDLSSLHTGLHMVRIQAQGLVQHQKLVVKIHLQRSQFTVRLFVHSRRRIMHSAARKNQPSPVFSVFPEAPLRASPAQ